MNIIASPSTMDRNNIIMTWLVTLLLGSVLFMIESSYGRLGFASLFAFLYVFIYGHIPTRYRVDEKACVLEAPFKKLVIPLDEITAVRSLCRYDQQGLFRLFGSGGLFGYWGYFYSHTLGRIKIYARRNNHWILIVTRYRGRYVIAPDDPDFFDLLKGMLLVRRVS